METSLQSLGQGRTPTGSSPLTVNAQGTKLPVPEAKTHAGGVLRSDVRPVATIVRVSGSERVCAGNFASVCVSLFGGSM